MVEKESRLLEMAARHEAHRDSTIQRVTKSSASSLSSSLSSLSLGSSFSGQGRVRKLFEDRRSTGYDKSYPLHPVKSNKSPAPAAKPVAKGAATGRGSGYGGGYGQPQQRSRSQVPSNHRNNALNKPSTNLNNANSNRFGLHKSNPSLLDASNNNPSNNRFGRLASSAEVTPSTTPSPSTG